MVTIEVSRMHGLMIKMITGIVTIMTVVNIDAYGVAAMFMQSTVHPHVVTSFICIVDNR